MGKRFHITAWFGNGDEYNVHLRMNVRDWKSILAGQEFSDTTRYRTEEGERITLDWMFNGPGRNEVEISGSDGGDYYLNELSDLYLEIGGVEQDWRGKGRPL